MSKDQSRRSQLVARLADHVLAHGLAAASLRPLARAAGTSDRMLLYYFADKAELLGAVLDELAARLMAHLEALASPGPLPAEALRRHLTRQLLADDLQPYMRLWLELASGAARGEPLLLATGGRLGRAFLAWGAAQLAVADEAERAAEAARLLMAVKGAVLLAALGLEDAVGLTLAPAGG